MKPIYDASQALFPSVYRVYPDNQPFFGPTENREYVKRGVRLAMELSEGKPVYPYIWHRYPDFNPVQGYRLIPAAELKAQVAAVFETNLDGRRADGVMWWGADQYFYWMATHYPHGGPPEFAHGPWLAQVFEDEMAPGETAAQYFTRIHKRTIKLFAEVLNALPAVEDR